MEERVVNFNVEAERSLKEVSYAIQDGSMSSTLSSSGEVAYFNLTTREGSKFTVRLCMRGFQVVGHSYDSAELDDTDGGDTNTEPVFETVYALLNHLSPSYQTTFNSAVADKLKKQCLES